MNKRIILATGNKNKLIEFKRMLEPLGIQVEGIDKTFLDGVIENGETFEENALIKAKAVYDKIKLPVIADDSGLCIDALNGAPGVYSARYLGEETGYSTKIEGILHQLKEVGEKERTARFECAISFVDNTCQRVFMGTCEGHIGEKPMGENGFGYDPIFFVGEKSYSQLTDCQKDLISHRKKAIEALCKEINNLI